MATAYESDIIAWANEQASLLRSGLLSAIDIEHIAEEIEDVGKSEQRELASRMVILLVHLLKWHYQPERQGMSWSLTIKEQRKAILRRINKTPSLNATLNDVEWWEDVWLDAKTATEKETGIAFEQFPETSLWSIESILTENWLPS